CFFPGVSVARPDPAAEATLQDWRSTVRIVSEPWIDDYAGSEPALCHPCPRVGHRPDPGAPRLTNSSWSGGRKNLAAEERRGWSPMARGCPGRCGSESLGGAPKASQRLLGRPVSESGTLCRGDGSHEGDDRAAAAGGC